MFETPEIRELRTRKRALAAESDAYRELLMHEAQTLRLHVARATRVTQQVGKVSGAVGLMSVLWSAVSALRGHKNDEDGKRNHRFGRWAALALTGVSVYRKIAPYLK
jgi:hypothetical protein